MTPRRAAPGTARWRVWWSGLPARDRRALTLAAVAVAALVVWLWGVAPAWRALRTLPSQQQQALAEWHTMQGLAQQARSLQGAVVNPLSASEARRQAQAATAATLGASASLQPQGDAVQVTLRDAPADAIARWMQQVRINARLKPSALQLERGSTPDRWSGSITLQGPEAPER